ncbi:hypothetical protein HMPREF0653_02013 [Prevotella disiens JCM 6334 = ATCC 29426]|uniref:Uncharacterized protein n=1 Tax=Prevotella disiens JCM 6334 = ATCC 29426 TaxID=1235811 RepID=A0ABP2Y5C4_9BACT|nr:hypothetical protein HMPREF0653_02013 [Prevotella disiens JCM 6334 = ATCC 29426]
MVVFSRYFAVSKCFLALFFLLDGQKNGKQGVLKTKTACFGFQNRLFLFS